MKYLKKIGLFLVIFAFIFQTISMPIYAMASEEQIKSKDLQTATVLLDENEEDVPLYEEDSETSEVLSLLQSDDEVVVLERLDDFSFVEYIQEDDKEEILQGFLLNEYLNFNENEILDDIQTATILSDEDEIDVPLYEEDSEDSEILTFLQSDDEVVVLESSDDFSFVEYAENDEKFWQGFINNHFLKFKSSGDIKDDPDKDSTNDEEDQDVQENESIENTDDEYSDEHSTSEDVYTDEEASGMTDSNDSESSEDNTNIDDSDDQVDTEDQEINAASASLNLTMRATIAQTSLEGIALKNPTAVYVDMSTSSKSLKTYPVGSILKYSLDPNLNDWYRTGVFINGVKQTGYIHKSHVENAIENQVLLEGIALQNSTSVYTNASTSSKSLKSYPAGSILKYYTYSKDWYRTGVYINGKKQTGYIRKSHVENALENQVLLEGIALQNSTSVHTNASTSSKALRSYPAGSILKYYTYSKDWYRTGVYINGKKRTGYIRKSHVENATENPKFHEGIALQSPTSVYTNASTGSKALRSYPAGSILKYYSYSKDWYRTGVYINGKKQTGYIHRIHVENATSNPEYKKGLAVKQPAVVYSSASTNSKALKSYSSGKILIYYTYSKDWYRTGVYIDGVKVTGYIHNSHVSETLESNYNISLKEAAAIQVKANGQTDKNYKTYVHKDYINNNTVTANTLNVRGGPGTDYWAVGQLKQNDKVTILNTTGNWHEIEFTKNHQWVNASPEDISHYLDPKHFINDPVQRFQFLDLSRASNTSVASLNSYLADKGILKGHGQTFINAGSTHNVNDAYLMSHALLETGNGTSQLATGNEVGLNSSGKATLVTSSNRGQLTSIKTVYNMYGIGANDGRALEGGAIRAYEEEWTTPERAIIGGAKFIGEKYIHGINNTNTVQNTLYKMRWNPEYMAKSNVAGHQYATDIGWASKQVSRISSIYKDLGNDFIILDIPIYR